MSWNDLPARGNKHGRPGPAVAAARAVAALALTVWLAVPALAGAATALAGPGAPGAPGAPTRGPQGPARLQAVSGPAAEAASLVRAYARARMLPAGAVAGIRKGTLRVATDPATGIWWALASFAPAAGASARLKAGFQDGASTAVFTRTRSNGWRLTHLTGAPFACSSAIPAAARAAWHLSRPAGCSVTAAAARRAALRARSALRMRPRMPAVTGSGIASIALGQVGVSDTPAETSFSSLDCDPYSTMDGPPTPNADGCGVNTNFSLVNENEEWCSDFAKWVWQQAGVTADIPTLNAGANSFYAWGLQQGESMPADSGSAAVGDAVVFYPAGTITSTTFADHVGLVTAVNANGTINMANGDFLGSTNIGVQYDTEIKLSTWASQTWGSGEQWVFVTPPTAAQPAAPTATITAAASAVAGTSIPLTATAAEPGGSISGYQWTFGDGALASGAAVTHVFGNPGQYTVAMTATSNLGTATTTTWNIDVVSPSSAVVSTQSNQVWYTSTPLLQDLYQGSSSAGLSEQAWDGAGWLDQSIPGQPSGSATAALNYPGSGDAVVPHVFFRASGGTLAQTSGGDGGWSTGTLAGTPEAGSAIVATTVNDATSARGAAPEVFYFGSGGTPSESSGVGGSWTTSTLPGPATGNPASLALADTTTGGTPSQLLFYTDGGELTVTSSGSAGWQTQQVSSPTPVAAGTPLAALTSGPGGLTVSVFFVDQNGLLAQATSAVGSGTWAVSELPGPAASTAGLAASDYQLADGSTSAEVFYLDASGQPVEDSLAGTTWQSATLPGTATGLPGAAAFPAADGPQQLFLADGSAVTEDSAATAGGSWTATSLPATPTTYAGRILLYAASSADYVNAQAAAKAAGLPEAQVTDNFDVAWAATLSGDYLVIAIGTAAVDALYVNDCGWPNPSDEDLGTTPFYYYVAPYYGLAGTDAFVNATAASSSKAVAAATDAAYYALNHRFPSGVKSMPTLSGPNYECEGSPS